MTESFFFSARDGTPLLATWRGTSAPSSDAAPCWVVCPPFAEEAKSAHRTLVEVCEALRSRGASTLCFSYRGTGDSGGAFCDASLSLWREDIVTACEEAQRRSGQRPALLGLRLGASLALQATRELNVADLVLIEPVMAGRTLLMQLGARRKLREVMTEEATETANRESASTPQIPLSNSPGHDYDGWPLGEKLREELHELNLLKMPPSLPDDSRVLLLQVGSKLEVAPPLQKWAADLENQNVSCQVETRAIVMPPFWNRLDLVKSTPLCEAVAAFEYRLAPHPVRAASTRIVTCSLPENAERVVSFQNGRDENLFGIWHDASSVIRNPQSTVLLLHGWTGTRSGPHQMLTRAARRFAAEGHSVFRFDFAGRGDSEGDAELATLATMTEDARAALRWIEGEQGSTHLTIVGLCSGCEIALATTALAPKNVKQLVLWSAPVFAAQQSDARRARKRRSHLRDYARKLLRPTTWAKAISGKVDVRGVQRVLAEGGGQEGKNIESGDAGQLPRGWRSGVLEKFRRTRLPMFMIYGTADPTTHEALDWHRELMATRKFPVSPEVHLVSGANHSYYGLEWEAEVIDVTARWLGRICDSG
jgi:pimeloyl-ACP methyl ester carboxylesterase